MAPPKPIPQSTGSPSKIPFSSVIGLDPDNQLNPSEKQQFIDLHKAYACVFNPAFGAYNDFSGKTHTSINIDPVIPLPCKGKLLFYIHSNLCLLQEEADKLEALGVLAKPEDIGVDVKFAWCTC